MLECRARFGVTIKKLILERIYASAVPEAIDRIFSDCISLCVSDGYDL